MRSAVHPSEWELLGCVISLCTVLGSDWPSNCKVLKKVSKCHNHRESYTASRDLQIVFFVRIESRIESAVRFVFESNLRIESAVYTTQAVTQPDGLQAYRTGL